MTLLLVLILLPLVWYSATMPQPLRMGLYVVLIVLLVVAVLGYAGAPIIPPHWR